MVTLDTFHRHVQPSPAIRSLHAWLRWIGDVAVGVLTLIAFLAVAFVALYLHARLGMPSL